MLNGIHGRRVRHQLSNNHRWWIWYGWLKGELKLRRTRKAREYVEAWDQRIGVVDPDRPSFIVEPPPPEPPPPEPEEEMPQPTRRSGAKKRKGKRTAKKRSRPKSAKKKRSSAT